MRIPISFALAVFLGLTLSSPCRAEPVLHCAITQGNVAQSVQFQTTADPYTVAAVTINENFRFKAVVFRDQTRVEYVKLYAYYLTRRQAVLLQQANYLSPVIQQASEPKSLTGEQRLYSPILGDEFQYNCALLEVAS